jgi:hypothetical protein
MKEIEISRRQVLATVGTAGGAGALTGSGAAAYLSENVSFTRNEILSGSIDLRVDWDVDDGDAGSSEGDVTVPIELTDENRSGTATFDVLLPDDGSNNPAYGWFRMTCPEITELVTDLEVALSYACNRSTIDIAAGTLCEVAEDLRNGLALDPECDPDVDPTGRKCLQPGEPVTLVLEWELGDGFKGKDETALTFDFVASQCRYRDGTENPFPEAQSCDCPDGHAISWVAFCGEYGEPYDEDDFEFDVTVDTLTLHDAPDTLDSVVLKYATYIRVFENPGTSGVFTTTSGGTEYDQDGSGFEGTDRTNAEPCSDGCGLKFEGDDDFDSAESTGCDS